MTSDHSRNPVSQGQWGEVLQSALLRLLDLAKTAEGQGQGGESTSSAENEASHVHEHNDIGLLLAVAVFMLHAPTSG